MVTLLYNAHYVNKIGGCVVKISQKNETQKKMLFCVLCFIFDYAIMNHAKNKTKNVFA